MTPPRLTPKRRTMNAAEVQIRLRAARKFLEAAEMYAEGDGPSDWQVAGANAVSAGIAASDAITGKILGYCAQGDAHGDALAVLEEATTPSKEPRKHLSALLTEKSGYQYGAAAVRHDVTRSAVRHARHLVDAAEKLVAGP